MLLEDPQTKHCKEILRKNDLNPIERLGKGGFGTVYLVSKIDFQAYDTQLYSVKCTSKKNFVKKPVLRRYLKQEIGLMKDLQHPNIVKLHKTFEAEGWIFMLMEYCNMGNLGSILSKRPNKVLPLPEAKKIICEVIDGLEYMHERKIVHRDIKPQNILLTKNEDTDEVVTKICDLGFSRQIQEEADTVCGTTYYMAPQIFSKEKYDHKVDIWALGVLFYSLIFGSLPFKSINMLADIQTKCSNGFDIDCVKTKPNESITETDREMLNELFQKIFQLSPQKRYSLSEIKYALGKESVYSSKSRSQKQTIQSDISSQEQLPPLYLQKVQFVQTVLKESCQLHFLNEMEQLALKYYLDKVCLSILSQHGHSGAQCKHLGIREVERLYKSQEIENLSLSSNLNKVGIKKFDQVFSQSNTSYKFQNFKEAYRLVVGHAFYRAHKTIGDVHLKSQIKLKLFCCHVINRVFDEGVNQEVFKDYYKWLQKRHHQKSLNLQSFKQWIQNQETDKVLEAIEAINIKFYKKRE